MARDQASPALSHSPSSAQAVPSSAQPAACRLDWPVAHDEARSASNAASQAATTAGLIS